MIRKLIRKGKELLKGAGKSPGAEPLALQPGPSAPGPPSHIYIIINKVCNLRCRMCDIGQQNRESQFYQVMAREGRELDLGILKKLVDEVAGFRPTLAVTSTEPLLYKDLIPFVLYAKEAGLPVQITTNGLLLPGLAEEIVKSGVDSLWVSIDGPRDAHNLIRGNPSSYRNAVEGIEKAAAAREKYSSGISISVNCSISHYNDSCLADFLCGISGLPLDSVSFSHMNYVTEKMAELHNSAHGSYCTATSSSVAQADPLEVDVEALSRQISLIKAREWPFPISFSPDLDQKGIGDFYQRPEVVIASRTCSAAFNMAQLASNGDWVITTRCFSLSMGNLFDEPFMTTWQGEKYKRFRSWISETGLSPACTRCCGAL